MAEKFQKIDVANGRKPDMPARKKRSLKWMKPVSGVFAIAVVILAVLFVAIAIPARKVQSDVQVVSAVGREAYTALKNQDIEGGQAKLAELKEKLLVTQKDLGRLAWVGFIPIVGNYERDAERLVRGGIAGIEAAQLTVDTIVPYADLLGLKGKSTFVAGSADERIRTAVETLDKIIPNIDAIAAKIEAAETELKGIDENRYPEKIGKTVVRDRIKTGKLLFAETASLFVEAQPLLKKLPDVLGNKEPKRYLVLFQNDKELRATGGFLTAYGVFKIDKGKIQVETSQDIYKLDEAKKKKFPAPAPILKYHKNVFTLELRDSNLSPDYLVSMKEFERMLSESVSDFPKYDGIIALDTHVLVSTIRVLGEFNIYGRTFSAENDKRCDCPKAIYELEDYSTKPVAYIREERKDIIGVLLLSIMQKALGVSPSQYWGKLSQVFLEEARQKHILFYFHDADAQKGIESLNFGGRIVPFTGDYLHISDVNMAGAKSNLFVKHTVKQDIKVENDGSLTKTVTVSYKNPAPPSNCNLEAGQLCLNGILRNWVRLYVPKGSKLQEFKGSETDTVVYDELDKTVIEGFLTVKPQGATDIIVRYTVPAGVVQKGKPFQLLIQKQPGTDGHDYTVLKDGRQIAAFPLLTDKEVTVK